MHILEHDYAFNSDKFFSVGGSPIRLSRDVYQKLEMAIDNLEWVKDPDGIYNQVPLNVRLPESEIPKGISKKEKLKMWAEHVRCTLNSDLKEAIESLFLSEHFEQLQHAFDFEVKFLDLWCGSEGCPWHSDITDSADALILAYFSDHQVWVPGFGGELEIGKQSGSHFGNMGLFTSKVIARDVESLGFVTPAKRNAILVNNQNPMFVHRCNRLSSPEIKRRTLTVGVDFICKDNPNAKSVMIW